MCDAVPLHDDSLEHVVIGAVGVGSGRKAAMRLHVAGVQRPLASAAKVAQAGNRVVMSSNGSFIEHEKTGERIPLRVERGTFVFDVQYQGGTCGTITLASGAGVNVWPEHLLTEVPMGPPDAGLRMTAANGTQIASCGTKLIEFTAKDGGIPGFTRHA
jgi:hypothetical protein